MCSGNSGNAKGSVVGTGTCPQQQQKHKGVPTFPPKDWFWTGRGATDAHVPSSRQEYEAGSGGEEVIWWEQWEQWEQGSDFPVLEPRLLFPHVFPPWDQDGHYRRSSTITHHPAGWRGVTARAPPIGNGQAHMTMHRSLRNLWRPE